MVGLKKALGLQEAETPGISRQFATKIVRFSTVGTGRHYLSGHIPGTHFS